MFIYNNYFIISSFYRFLGFIDLLIREKIIDFFIIIFFSFFFLSFLFYSSRLLYLSRQNKICVKTYVKIDKIYDYICDNLSHLFYFPRLSRYNKICDKICVKIYVEINKIYDNICDKYYYYNNIFFNNINIFNIKNIIILFN